MVIEIDDGVIFVHQPNRAVSVLRLRNPVTNNVASHVGLLIEIRKVTGRRVSDARRDGYQRGSLLREGPREP